MKYLVIIAFYCLIVVTKTKLSPATHDYFLSMDGKKCSLISLSAYVSASYETKFGTDLKELSFDEAKSNQFGLCSDSLNSIFNISLTKNENLIFHFQNVGNKVILENITFVYNLPNINFPNAILQGTVIATARVNKTLSSVDQFYECLSYTEFNLSNDVTFKVFGIKLKVFNVENGSFGVHGLQCLNHPISSWKSITNKPVFSLIMLSTKPSLHSTNLSGSSDSSFEITAMTQPDPKFVIRDKTSLVCLLLSGQMFLSVTFTTISNSQVVKVFSILPTTNYSGSCSQLSNTVSIHVNKDVSFTLTFTKAVSTATLYQFQAYIFWSSSLFPNATNANTNTSANFLVKCFNYQVDIGGEYYCKNTVTLGNTTINLRIIGFKFEAFRTTNSTDFSNKVLAKCPDGLTTGQIFAMILFGLLVSILLGLTVVALIRKCARYYRYQKVQINDDSA